MEKTLIISMLVLLIFLVGCGNENSSENELLIIKNAIQNGKVIGCHDTLNYLETHNSIIYLPKDVPEYKSPKQHFCESLAYGEILE